MPVFRHWTDLHLEFRPFDWRGLDWSGIDGILIGGDTDVELRHLDFDLELVEGTGLPVVMIWGNHEAYGSDIDDLRSREHNRLAELRNAGVPLHVLHGDAIEIAGARIIGATLWTDFELFEGRAGLARVVAADYVMDYRAIRRSGRGLKPDDTAALHATERRRILSLLDEPFDGPTLVMTHHMPSFRCVSARYATDYTTPAFASELLPDILDRHVDAWLYGHSHDNVEFDAQGAHGPIRFRSNPRGYNGERTRFDPEARIAVGAR